MKIWDAHTLSAYLEQATAARRAVVIGGSLAGLLAARVLERHFDEVILLERDALPESDTHRKATPHTRHAHGLLARGLQIVEGLFPGLHAEWIAAGARDGDIQRDIAFYAGPRRFAAGTCGVKAVALGRALLEGTVRRRVLGLPRVHAATGLEVHALQAQDQRVTGVRTRGIEGGKAFGVPAQLVVDCSGRASRLPQWLQALGLQAPAEDRVDVDVHYATAYFDRAGGPEPGVEAAICTPTAERPQPGALMAQEGRRWVITLGGYGADAPPLDRAGFAARARSLSPEMGMVADAARFEADPIGYRFTHSQRRRYERLRDLPQGLLAMGDAMCSLNPIYGQGMTVSACEAELLDEVLDEGGAQPERRFFKRAARIVDAAWNTTAGADLALPMVPGPRPHGAGLINTYVSSVFRASQRDAEVGWAFLRVAHLLAPPQSLMHPATLARVLRHRFARG